MRSKVQFLFQIRYCKKKLQIVKEAASMQSVDMAIVTKLESEININELATVNGFTRNIKYRDNNIVI